MKNANIVIIIVVLVGALLFANKMSHQNGPTTPEAIQMVNEEAARLRAADTPPPSQQTMEADRLPAEITYHLTKGTKHLITIGWYFDSSNQSDPLALIDIVEAAKRVADKSPDTGVVAVNLDVPEEERSQDASRVDGLGVALDGSYVFGHLHKDFSGNPGEGDLFAFEKVETALDEALNIKPDDSKKESPFDGPTKPQ